MTVFTDTTVSGSDEVTDAKVADDVRIEQSCWALCKAWSNSSANPVTSVSLSEIASIAISLSPPDSDSEPKSVSMEGLDALKILIMKNY